MATRTLYWVGGTGAWSETAHWSLSSGGAGGEAVPDSDDDVHFDAGSNTTNAAYTVTVDVTANCRDLMFDAKPGDGLGGTITLAGSATLNVYGSLLLLAGMTVSKTGNMDFLATSVGKTITCNGVTLTTFNARFFGSGGGWSLQDNFNTSSAGNGLQIGVGGSTPITFNTNNHTIYASQLNVSSSGAVFNAGTSTLNIGGFVYSSGTANVSGTTINIPATTGGWGLFTGGGQTFGTATFAVEGASSHAMTGANTFTNLSFTGAAVKTTSYSFAANQTVTGTFTATGNSATNLLLVQSNTLGTPRTITAAAVALTNCDFMDITGAGAALWYGGTLGSELATNGSFSADTNWTKAAGCTIAAGVANFVGVGSSSAMYQNGGAQVGKLYLIEFEITEYTSGTITPQVFGAPEGPSFNSVGVKRALFITTTADSNIGMACWTAFTGKVDNFSCKEITGSIGNALGNSGITFTPAADQYFYAPTTGTKLWSGVANWFLGAGGTGGAGRVPLPQDNAIFNASSIGAASTTVSADMPRLGKDITFVGVVNSPTWNLSTYGGGIYGSLTTVSAMSIISNNTTDFRGRSSHTLTSGGLAWPSSSALSMNMFGGTLTLGDALNTSSISPVYGTLVDAGYSVTMGTFGGGNGSVKTLNLTGIWTITGAAWEVSSTTVITSAPSTIKFTDATATAKTFVGGGKAYNTVWLSGAGSGAYNFTGANTIADLKVDNLPKDIRFTAGTNTTIGAFTNADVPVADEFVRLPGVSGSNFSTLDSAALTLPGDAEFIFYLRPPTWSTDLDLMERYYSGSTAYFLYLQNGDVACFFSLDGTTLTGGVVGGAVKLTTRFSTGQAGYIKISRTASTGTVIVSTSVDGVTYTALSSPVASTAGTIFDSTRALTLFPSALLAPGVGDLYRFQLYDGIGGTLVADFNPNDHDSGNTWPSSTTGEVWTRNGSALIYPEIKISSITAATHTLTKSGGGVVALRNWNITNSIASPAATFYAGAKSTNGGGNTNWTFNNAPAYADASQTDQNSTLLATAYVWEFSADRTHIVTLESRAYAVTAEQRAYSVPV